MNICTNTYRHPLSGQAQNAGTVGCKMRTKRFPPTTRTAGLAALLRPRTFAGAEEDTLVEGRVAHWHHANAAVVLLSPAPGRTGTSLARNFETVAAQYFVELRSRSVVGAQTPTRWLQHWPARDGAPWPYEEDQFENVQLVPAPGGWQLHARQLVSVVDALRGSPLSVHLGVAAVNAHTTHADR